MGQWARRSVREWLAAECARSPMVLLLEDLHWGDAATMAHLGEAHALSQADRNLLAAVCDLGGGHVRNAVLTAAVLARKQKRAIAFSDIVQGLLMEYGKLGRPLPVELQSALPASDS